MYARGEPVLSERDEQGKIIEDENGRRFRINKTLSSTPETAERFLERKARGNWFDRFDCGMNTQRSLDIEKKDVKSVPIVKADDGKEKTGFRAASLANRPDTSSRHFKIGSFWSKLRDLSAAKPAQPEEAQSEVQEVDEQEVEEDLKIAKELARGSVGVVNTVVKEDTSTTSLKEDTSTTVKEVPSTTAPSEVKIEYSPPPHPQTNQPPITSPFDAITPVTTPTPKAKPKRATDLLTSLFPDSVRPNYNATRPISRIPFTPTITNLLSAVSAQEASLIANASETARLRRQQEQEQRWRGAIRGDVGMLVLRKASKNLDFDDFARVAPGIGTKHLSGWNGSGDIVRVIRARDTVTFEPSTNYFIVFKNEQAAKAYHDHVLNLHNYARTFSPVSGSMSERVAGGVARRLRLDPEVLQLEVYCLALPGHDLDIKLVRQPFSPLIRKVLDAGGYIGLADEQHRVSDWEVLLSMDAADLAGLGTNGALSAVRKALVADGQSKGVLWNIVGKWSGVREVKAGMSKDGYDGEDKTRESGMPLHRKFVISFPSEDEAVRFVGSWHKKDVRSLMPSVLDQESVVVDAEVVW